MTCPLRECIIVPKDRGMLKNNETIIQAARVAPLITKEMEAASALAWQRDGDVAAREILFRSHLRLVVKIVMRMKGQSARSDDLLSAGALGLLVAIDRFDPETGFRLSTYAPFWIRSHLADDVYAATNVVKLPTTDRYKRAIAHYADARRRLRIEHDGRLTHRECIEVASLLEVPLDVVQMADARWNGWSVSMQAPSGSADNPGSFGDRFRAEGPDPEQETARTQREDWARRMVAMCLESLSPRERDVFVRRELNDDCTLQDLADEFGVTRQRVQQIQAKAARKFAKAAMRHRAIARLHFDESELLSAA